MRKRISIFLLVVGLYIAILIGFMYAPLNSSANRYDFLYGGETEGETIQITMNADSIVSTPVIPSFTRFSLSNGIAEVANGCGKILSVPKWLPKGMVYADVYIGGGAVIIAFSDSKTADFTSAKITIEAVIYDNPPSEATIEKEYEYEKQHPQEEAFVTVTDPSGNTCNFSLGKTYPKTFFDVGNVHITLIAESEPPIAYFWKDGIYYLVGVRPPLTSQDLVEIIKNMGD